MTLKQLQQAIQDYIRDVTGKDRIVTGFVVAVESATPGTAGTEKHVGHVGRGTYATRIGLATIALDDLLRGGGNGFSSYTFRVEDATHSLLDALRQAEAERDKARAQVDQVRALLDRHGVTDPDVLLDQIRDALATQRKDTP